MNTLTNLAATFGAVLALESSFAPPAFASSAERATAIKLYTLDCGLTQFTDAAVFSDTGEYDGEPIELPTPCYLIRHGDDWLLWDTGNGDHLAALRNGVEMFGGRFTQPRTLVSQLAELGITPADVDYVAISHLHQDHTGNINLFSRSTFLIAGAELAWAQATPTPFGVNAEAIAPLRQARIETTDEDKDVFGDASVRILKAPGHTPGSRMLLINLPDTGPVLITGDLFHTRDNYRADRVPAINSSRAETLASSRRFRTLAQNLHARVVVQHAPEDYAAMPTFPAFLD